MSGTPVETVGLVVLLAAPAAVVLALYLRSRRRLRTALSSGAFRTVRASWLGAVTCLLLGPALTLYSTWTTVGRVAAPAPGPSGLRVAGWLTLGGIGLVVLGVGVAAGDRTRRRLR